MSRSNYDKPFYVDVGTSIVAVRCASNHDIVLSYDHTLHPFVIKLLEDACDRMNKEAEIGKPPRNCDVGTPKEQEVRFDAWVRDMRGDLNCTGKCPAHNGVDFGVVNCVLQWAQMPYAEEGGAK